MHRSKHWIGSLAVVLTVTGSHSVMAQTAGSAGSTAASRAAMAGAAVGSRRAETIPALNELLSPPTSELAHFVGRFTSDRNALRRFYDLESPQSRARMAEFYHGWRARLAEVAFEELDVEGRIDHVLLRNRLTYELRRLELAERWADEMRPLLPFESELVRLHESRRRLERVDPKEAAAVLDRVAAAVERTRASVAADLRRDEAADDALRPTPVIGRRAASRLQDVKRAVDGWYRFFNGYDPLFDWWVREPYRRFSDQVDGYIAFLRGEVAGIDPEDPDEPIIGDPVGREALLLDLTAEMIPYGPEELIAIAEQELAWGEAQMRAAARELGFGDDWHAALEHVKTLHVQPGEQPALVRDLAREAEDLMEDGDLVSVPPLAREVWRMEMLSAERQRIAPFFLGGEVVQVAYPTAEMTHPEKAMSLRANNRHFSRNAVQHELIPGHHLQGFMVDRYNTHRREFSTPFWQEGWALYWELLLWDLGFPRSPEDRIGMLFWRNHRAARIIFSLNFHLGEMTADEAISLLVERVGHEPSSATAEVRRSFIGTYPPLYQVAYMIGGLQFRALHRELVENGTMTDREFHDHILRRGSIPVEMVRASLLNQAPGPDYRPSWRFYHE